jgi:hypothetical protein
MPLLATKTHQTTKILGTIRTENRPGVAEAQAVHVATVAVGHLVTVKVAATATVVERTKIKIEKVGMRTRTAADGPDDHEVGPKIAASAMKQRSSRQASQPAKAKLPLGIL